MPSTPSAGGAAGEGSLSRGASPRASLQAAATAPAAVSVASIREVCSLLQDLSFLDITLLPDSGLDTGPSLASCISAIATWLRWLNQVPRTFAIGDQHLTALGLHALHVKLPITST